MVKSQFSLTWHQFHKSLSTGFSELQQNGEFVDMTLAADGHMVKVHQMLLALASPYFKELIRSAPCPHPVIFLTGVSHKTLTYLLEYIYTGQALVPCEDLSTFLSMGKALHIRGLEDVSNVEGMTEVGLPDPTPTLPTPAPPRVKGTSQKYNVGASATQVDLPSAARNVYLKREQDDTAGPPSKKASMTPVKELDDDAEYLEEPSHLDDFDDNDDADKTMTPVKSTSDTSTPAGKTSADTRVQYTVSYQGNLQMVLNRYVYYMASRPQSTRPKSQVLWRCADYRKTKCPALVRTQGDVVVSRSHLHNHPFHDKRILRKIRNNEVFSAVQAAQAHFLDAQRKDASEMSGEEDKSSTDLKNDN